MSKNHAPEEKIDEEIEKETKEEVAGEIPEESKEQAETTETPAAPGAEEELAKLKDTYLRTLAEYDNYRKRTTKEKEQSFGRGVTYAAEAILPVVDNFERALASAKDPDDAFVKGIALTYKQMMDNLAKIGITPIEAKGAQFDPHFHNAVMHVDDENFGENEIVEVFLTGYMYNDTLLRAAMVKVAN